MGWRTKASEHFIRWYEHYLRYRRIEFSYQGAATKLGGHHKGPFTTNAVARQG